MRGTRRRRRPAGGKVGVVTPGTAGRKLTAPLSGSGGQLVKAKPTEHRGVLMRSRLEAQWAGVLDRAGIEWQYEPVNFSLPGRVGYCPDFRLTRLDAWLEVKGPHFDRIEKTRALARKLGAGGLVLVGTSPGICWRALPSGGASALEIGYGRCGCGVVAVGPVGRRGSRLSTGGALSVACRACGRGTWAQGILGW